jgi:hypothetical protein
MVFPLIAAGIGLLTSFIAGEKNGAKGNTDRKFQEHESQRNREWQKEQQQINHKFQHQQAELDRQFKEKESAASREHQIKVHETSHTNAVEIQRIGNAHQIELEHLRQQNQRELIELQHQQAQEMLLARQEFERESAILAYQWAKENFKHQIELGKIFTYWPLRIAPSQLLEGYDPVSVPTIPLNIFLINTANTPSRDFDVSIGADLRQFVTQLNAHGRLVEFFDKAWLDGVPGGGAAVKILQSFLRSMPTLIVEVEFFNEGEERFFNLNFAYWGLDPGYYSYSPLLSKIACNSFATEQELMQSISLCLKFLAGICTDAHYIKHYAFAPILPYLLREMVDVSQPDASPVVEELVTTYCKALESLGDENRFLLPEWQIAIAKELTYIPRLANQVADSALESWYKTKQS